MGMLKLDAVVHWSIPVNNLEEAENFYGEICQRRPMKKFAICELDRSR